MNTPILTVATDIDWLRNFEDTINNYHSMIVDFKEEKLTNVKEDYTDNCVYGWTCGLISGEMHRYLRHRRINRPDISTVDDSSGNASTDSDSNTSQTYTSTTDHRSQSFFGPYPTHLQQASRHNSLPLAQPVEMQDQEGSPHEEEEVSPKIKRNCGFQP